MNRQARYDLGIGGMAKGVEIEHKVQVRPTNECVVPRARALRAMIKFKTLKGTPEAMIATGPRTLPLRGSFQVYRHPAA